MAERLISPFNTITAFFLRHSVEKAFQLDEQPASLSLDEKVFDLNPPFITSAVDDIMYIVSQILDKSIKTSQRAVVANIVPTISRVLSSDFIGMIQRKLRDEHYPRVAANGGPPPDSTIVAFLVLLNDLDVAIEYTNRIVDSHTGNSSKAATIPATERPPPAQLHNLFPLDHDAAFVRDSLNALESSFYGKASELIGDGIFVAFKNVFRPRVRLALAEAFRDIDYQLTHESTDKSRDTHDRGEKQYMQGESTIYEKFQSGWGRLNKPALRILTARNSERLLTLLATYLSEILEKRIWSFYGRIDHHGAVRMERDVDGIINVVIRGGRYRLREIFSRCTQICLVMNLEEDEWEGLSFVSQANEQGLQWRLNEEERSRARAMVCSAQMP